MHVTVNTSVEALLGLMKKYSDGQGYTIRLMGGLGDQPFTLAEDKFENLLSRYSRTVLCCGGSTEEPDPPPLLSIAADNHHDQPPLHKPQ